MLRRRTPLKPSRGTEIPASVRREVRDRDGGRCLGALLGWPGECRGGIEQDHVRSSGALGMKSRSTADNLASLCLTHHDYKTAHGRECRPQLIAHIEGEASHG